jgi:hypothetical protein
MVIADNQLKLADIMSLTRQVPRYPISVKRLLELAKAQSFNKAVISFYKAFPENAVFTDKDDMLSRTEAIEIMQSQNPPPEDYVRGSED